jgi:hypothetical protein
MQTAIPAMDAYVNMTADSTFGMSTFYDVDSALAETKAKFIVDLVMFPSLIIKWGIRLTKELPAERAFITELYRKYANYNVIPLETLKGEKIILKQLLRKLLPHRGLPSIFGVTITEEELNCLRLEELEIRTGTTLIRAEWFRIHPDVRLNLVRIWSGYSRDNALPAFDENVIKHVEVRIQETRDMLLLEEEPPSFFKQSLRGRAVGFSMAALAFVFSILDEVDLYETLAQFNETVTSLAINDALTTSVTLDTLHAWQALHTR